VMRQLISCATFYLLLRILGVDILERGPLSVAGLAIAFMLFRADDLVSDLRANGETKQALVEGRDLQGLVFKWRQREIRSIRVHAVLGFLVGIAMTAGYVDLPGLDIPNWIGSVLMVLAMILLLFAHKFAVRRSSESMVMRVLPAGFSERE